MYVCTCLRTHIHTCVHTYVHEHQCVCTNVHDRGHLRSPPFLTTIGSLGVVSVSRLKSKECGQAIIKYKSKKNESKKYKSKKLKLKKEKRMKIMRRKWNQNNEGKHILRIFVKIMLKIFWQ